jgi:hypothetical protein
MCVVLTDGNGKNEDLLDDPTTRLLEPMLPAMVACSNCVLPAGFLLLLELILVPPLRMSGSLVGAVNDRDGVIEPMRMARGTRTTER